MNEEYIEEGERMERMKQSTVSETHFG
jgi:hypothetical protein